MILTGIDSSREVASRTTRAALLSKHGGLEVDLMNPSRFKKGRGAKETFTLKEYIETRMVRIFIARAYVAPPCNPTCYCFDASVQRSNL